MQKLLIFFVLVGSVSTTFGQSPAPEKELTSAVLIRGAEIHVGNGSVFNGNLLFENGIITWVSQKIEQLPQQVNIIDAQGKKVYPGLIAPNNTLGLNETASLLPTRDERELGTINPSVRALIAYNTDSEIIPTVRGNGVLIGQTTPQGGLVSGRSSIMNYDGWNWEDAVLKADDGLWLHWPMPYTDQYDETEERVLHKKNDQYDKQVAGLKLLFAEAKAYAKGARLKNNQHFEALKDLWTGSMKLYMVATKAKQIVAGLHFIRDMGIENVVLVDAKEALLVKDFLKSNHIPVLVSGTHRLPENHDEDIWAPYRLPAELWKAGLKVGMFYDDEFWRTRNLPFVAGTAAAYGLGKEEALQMITLNNAEILGIADKTGSLEAGKLATLFISSGDILDMRTAKVEHAFIAGRPVNLDDKQKRLAKKYVDKYRLK